MPRALVLTLLLLAPALARADDKPTGVAPIAVVALDHKEPVAYEKDVEPVFAAKCQVCHSGSVTEGKLDMGSYAALMKGGKRGPAVVPGKSAESRLVHLAGRTKKPTMPPKSEEPLSPQELALVKLWIDQGAKPPTGAREKPKIALTAPPALVKPVRAVAVSADKSMVAASRGNQVHVYDAGSGTHVRTLFDPGLKAADGKPVPAAHLSLVESLAFSADGKYLASGSFQEVIVWDAATGKVRQRIAGFADRVAALAFAAKGNLLATGGGAPTGDGEIKVFDPATGKLVVEIKNGHSDTVFGVCFSPDGTKLATCGADKFVKTFEIPSGKFLKSFEGHTHHVLDVGWKADGKLLASAGADNAVKVWNFETGEQVRTINAHGKQVTRLVFVGTTPQFVTCSGDQTVKMWNVDSGGNMRNFAGSSDFLYAVGVSPDGKIVAAGGEEGVVRLYNGDNGQLTKTLLPPGEPASPTKK